MLSLLLTLSLPATAQSVPPSNPALCAAIERAFEVGPEDFRTIQGPRKVGTGFDLYVAISELEAPKARECLVEEFMPTKDEDEKLRQWSCVMARGGEGKVDKARDKLMGEVAECLPTTGWTRTGESGWEAGDLFAPRGREDKALTPHEDPYPSYPVVIVASGERDGRDELRLVVRWNRTLADGNWVQRNRAERMREEAGE